MSSFYPSSGRQIQPCDFLFSRDPAAYIILIIVNLSWGNKTKFRHGIVCIIFKRGNIMDDDVDTISLHTVGLFPQV